LELSGHEAVVRAGRNVPEGFPNWKGRWREAKSGPLAA
jgi:hypothetical protein